jgi:hypothetical protein
MGSVRNLAPLRAGQALERFEMQPDGRKGVADVVGPACRRSCRCGPKRSESKLWHHISPADRRDERNPSPDDFDLIMAGITTANTDWFRPR